jgi:hypothetical protein
MDFLLGFFDDKMGNTTHFFIDFNTKLDEVSKISENISKIMKYPRSNWKTRERESKNPHFSLPSPTVYKDFATCGFNF